jgi:hypothetical protein
MAAAYSIRPDYLHDEAIPWKYPEEYLCLRHVTPLLRPLRDDLPKLQEGIVSLNYSECRVLSGVAFSGRSFTWLGFFYPCYRSYTRLVLSACRSLTDLVTRPQLSTKIVPWIWDYFLETQVVFLPSSIHISNHMLPNSV